jgi:N-acetylmuramoyl-L-alanine amidase
MNVVLDPGHGGRDPGAIGKITFEKENNLTLAMKVGEILQRHNVIVNYTRTRDNDFCPGTYDVNTDLKNRIAIANQFRPDVFVSLHNDAFNTQAKGLETHCFKFGGTDEKLAKCIQNQMVPVLGLINRGVKATNYYVLRMYDGKHASAALVEYGFIDSEEDVILAKMDTAAVAIAKGILEFLGIAYIESVIAITATTQPIEDQDPDIYLSVRVRRSKSEEVAKQIIGMGYACKPLSLA